MQLRLSRSLATAALLFALAAAPAQAPAQTSGTEPDALQDEFEALSEDARRALEEALARLGPILQSMMSMIDGVLDYEAPRVLPNGDILIPRRRDDPAPPPTDPDAPETLDL